MIQLCVGLSGYVAKEDSPRRAPGACRGSRGRIHGSGLPHGHGRLGGGRHLRRLNSAPAIDSYEYYFEFSADVIADRLGKESGVMLTPSLWHHERLCCTFTRWSRNIRSCRKTIEERGWGSCQPVTCAINGTCASVHHILVAVTRNGRCRSALVSHACL